MASHSTGTEDDSGELLSSQLTAPTALRKLVLNYLIHHCYTDTAQAFAHDGIYTSSTRSGGESSLAPSDQAAVASMTKKAKNGSYLVASGSTAPGSRSHTRHSTQQFAHPLSAPPLSREDSNMEIEVDSLLSLAGGRTEDGEGTSGNGHTNGVSRGIKFEDAEDTQMGEGSQSEANGHGHSLGNDELSMEELRSLQLRKGE
jgi:hypothetical protein